MTELQLLCRPAGGLRRSAGRAIRRRRRGRAPRGAAHQAAASLGRLEEVVAWLAPWQGRAPPRLDRVDVLVFAGNHGVTAQGVSAYPAEVTRRWWRISRPAAPPSISLRGPPGRLRVVPLALDQPTADFTRAPAMDEAGFLAAVAAGYDAVPS